jgi:hypothetical protein
MYLQYIKASVSLSVCRIYKWALEDADGTSGDPNPSPTQVDTTFRSKDVHPHITAGRSLLFKTFLSKERFIVDKEKS